MCQLGQCKNILGMAHVPSWRLKPHMNQHIHENKSNPNWPIKISECGCSSFLTFTSLCYHSDSKTLIGTTGTHMYNHRHYKLLCKTPKELPL